MRGLIDFIDWFTDQLGMILFLTYGAVVVAGIVVAVLSATHVI